MCLWYETHRLRMPRTLVTPSILILALWACPLDKTVGKEAIVLFAEGLGGHTLLQEAVVPQLEEDVLDNLGLLRRRRPAEVVKVDVEPLVGLGVLDVELVA